MRFAVQYVSPRKLGAPYWKTVDGADINECMELADCYCRKNYQRGVMVPKKDNE